MCSKARYQENDGNDVLANERHGFAILHPTRVLWQRLVFRQLHEIAMQPRK
jgi:hypothetical protein